MIEVCGTIIFQIIIIIRKCYTDCSYIKNFSKGTSVFEYAIPNIRKFYGFYIFIAIEASRTVCMKIKFTIVSHSRVPRFL